MSNRAVDRRPLVILALEAQGLRITFVLLLRIIMEDFQDIGIVPPCTQPLLTEAGFQ